MAAVRTPFVGRERELRLLRDRLATARSGGVALISGEAGIGKTRLVAELADHARTLGWRVLTGRAYASEGAPPYLPFDEALRGYVRAVAPGDLLPLLGDAAVDVALLLPSVRERLPALALPDAGGGDWEQHRALESVVTFIGAIARANPPGLVLALDDLHWADPPALRLLQYLARRLSEMPVLVVGAYRDAELHRTHPLQLALAEVQRDADVTSLSLATLSPADAAALVRALGDGAVAPAVVASIVAAAEGNPLLVRELVRHRQVEGHDLADAATAQLALDVPAGIRRLVNGQLARLTPEANRVLGAASVLGDGVTVDLLQRVTDLEVASLIDALDEAQRTGMLQQQGDGYHFSHALTRQAVLDGVNSARRHHMHRRAAEALERLHGDGAVRHVGALALHYRLAGPAVDQGKVIEYALRAADAADAVFAWEEAVANRQAALDRLAPDDHLRRCDILILLGGSQLRADDRPAAQDTLQQAASVARLIQSPAHVARAALALGGTGIETGAVDDLLVGLLEEAEAALGDDEVVLHARVVARLAVERRLEEAWHGRTGRSGEALALARRIGDPLALRYALLARWLVLAEATYIEERRDVVVEELRVAQESGDPDWILRAQLHHLIILPELADFVEWDRQLPITAARADQLRVPREQHIVASLQAMRALMTGRFADAERWAETALDKGRRALDQAAPRIHATQIFMLRREQGRSGEVEEPYRRFVEQQPHAPFARLFLGLICIDRGTAGLDEAREHFERIAVADFDTFARGSGWLGIITLLAELCAAVGDRRRATTLYELLLPHAALAVSIRPVVSACYGSAARYLGLLAATLSRWDEAAAHFEAAATMNQRIAARPMLAHTRRDYAGMLLARGRRSDRAPARALLTQALTAYDEMGMTTYADRTRATLAHPSLAGAPVRAGYPDGLTAREVDVLRLLARGRSNRQIAADLVVSIRTAENHIASIYGKTGAHGRAEATAYAIQHRLTERENE